MSDYIYFAFKTFYYLKDKINRLNTNITLQIKNDTEEYSSLYLRSVIYLNIEKIIRELDDENLIKQNIIFLILHELYHVEQVVDYNYYINDENYRCKKEFEVNYRAINYMINNYNDLENALSVKLNIEHLKYSMDNLFKNNYFRSDIDFERITLEKSIIQNLIYLLRDTTFDYKLLGVYNRVTISIDYNDILYKVILRNNNQWSKDQNNFLTEIIREIHSRNPIKPESIEIYKSNNFDFIDLIVSFIPPYTIKGIEKIKE